MAWRRSAPARARSCSWAKAASPARPARPTGAGPAGLPGRAEADELLAVARWLRREARAGSVRVVGAVSPPQAAALASVMEGVERSPSGAA